MDAGIACAAMFTLDTLRRGQRTPPVEDSADRPPVKRLITVGDGSYAAVEMQRRLPNFSGGTLTNRYRSATGVGSDGPCGGCCW